MTDLRPLWKHVLTAIEAVAPESVAYFRNLPGPAGISDHFFLSELAWVIYNSGFRESVVRAKWDGLTKAFKGFDPPSLVLKPYSAVGDAMAIFANKRKAQAVVDSARKVVVDSPVAAKLAAMSSAEALVYLDSYPHIGPVTRYHLARNIGLDVVKPDRHLVRLAGFCGYETPAALVAEIAALSGERVGVIDYVLWQWLAALGGSAYSVVARLLAEGSGMGVLR